MPDKNEGTPPADLVELTKTVNTLATSLQTLAHSQGELLKNVNTIADTIAKLPPATPVKGEGKDAGKDGAGTAVTLEQIGQLIDTKLTSANQQQQTRAQRDGYLADKLKDLPAAYRNQLGSDPAKFPAEEQAIRDQFKADLKANGAEPANVGNANADGGKTPEQLPAVDRSKMSPMDLLNSDRKA